MAFQVISGSTYSVNAELSTDAIAIFQKYIEGTATAEEAALVTDLGVTSYELKKEGEHDVQPGE